MIGLLSRIFIKNHRDYTSASVRQAYGTLSGILGICFNIILCIAKFFAGSLTGSISVSADAFNNLGDAGSSIVTLLGFKLASKKPDKDHPFGHGRIEYTAGLAVSALILLMGFELAKSSVEKLIDPIRTEFSWVTVTILCASILVKVYMAVYNYSIAKKISSPTVKATAADSLSDCISTSVVLISTLVNKYFGLDIDAWCGLGVALFIFWSGINSAKETLDPLLGKAPDREFVESVESIVLQNELIDNIHDLIVHDYGPGRKIISVHAEVDSSVDIMLLHDSIDNTERRLQDELHCIAVVHMDPIDKNDPNTEILKEKVGRIISETDPQLSFHDFRIVSGKTHTNIIFDLLIPHDYRYTESEISSIIAEKISDIDGGTYHAVINVEQSFC